MASSSQNRCTGAHVIPPSPASSANTGVAAYRFSSCCRQPAGGPSSTRDRELPVAIADHRPLRGPVARERPRPVRPCRAPRVRVRAELREHRLHSVPLGRIGVRRDHRREPHATVLDARRRGAAAGAQERGQARPVRCVQLVPRHEHRERTPLGVEPFGDGAHHGALVIPAAPPVGVAPRRGEPVQRNGGAAGPPSKLPKPLPRWHEAQVSVALSLRMSPWSSAGDDFRDAPTPVR